ncbi:MAG: hypothetical protein IMW89_17925 [Ktedonobacteraceae bacterium]|nr:hypothetical protein [Ktedonobacteraceae bacterium]
MRGVYFSRSELKRLQSIQTLLSKLRPQEPPYALILPGSPQPRGEVIIFPGSFNPPTIAHLALLKEAWQYAQWHNLRVSQNPHGSRQPMRVYAAFTKLTVDKEGVERPLLVDRIALLQILLQRRLPRTGIFLFNRGLYVEQAEAIHHTFPAVKRILFLIGFDKIVQILDPRYYSDRDAALTELFTLAELLVAPRGNAGRHELDELIHQPQNERFACSIHPLPLSDTYREVSSTRIRAGLDRRSVPHEVRRFMRETRAYAPPVRSSDGTLLDYYEQRVQRLARLGIYD